MVQLSAGTRIAQEKMAAGASAVAQPTGNQIYVDSTNGNDGNDGSSPRRPVKTLTRAVAIAAAGDTIILQPGGSETVTSTIAMSTANVKVVCPVANSSSGFTLTAAGTIDLITVSAADVHIEGLRLAHTGATANASGILASAAAHRLTVKNCVVDDNAIVTTFTGAGVEVTSGADDVVVDGCIFKQTKYGVVVVASSTNESDRLVVKDSTFFVGCVAAGFGVYAAQATGKLQAPQILRCNFIEADGDGSAAVVAWDGTDGTNATTGPVGFGAAVDQYLIADCRASTALSATFPNILGINSGAAGEVAACYTSAADSITNVYSDTTAIEASMTTISSAAQTIQTAVQTLSTLAAGDIFSDTTVIETSIGTLSVTAATIASDAAAIEGGFTNLSANVVIVKSDTTQIASDQVIANSDIAHIDSDVTGIASDTTIIETSMGTISAAVIIIASDTLATEACATSISNRTVTIASDTLATEACVTSISNRTVTIASDTLATEACATSISNRTVTIASDTLAIEATTVNLSAKAITIYSDTGVLVDQLSGMNLSAITANAAITVIASDTLATEACATSISNRTVTIASDAAVVEPLAVALDAWQPKVVHTSSVSLIAGTVEDVLTVSNGPVELLGLYMTMTEACDGIACTGRFQSDPTTGAANCDMCAAVELSSAAIADTFYITGTYTDAMVKAANGTAVARSLTIPQILFPGGVDLILQNADLNTGIGDIYCLYRPLVSGAVVYHT